MRALDSVLEHLELTPILDRTLPERPARFAPIPGAVASDLASLIAQRYPDGLFTHQALAIEKVLGGENVVTATATASGKSLAFAIPALQKVLESPDARCLFLYPTKALASDQLKTLRTWAVDAGLGDIVRRLDGDVQGDDRDEALRAGRIILTNADLVHQTMLRRNNDPQWARIFDHLALVVLDESHVYRGAFGSNMAYVLRRLRQVARNHGSSPQFLAASATSLDPAEHLKSLTGLPFVCVGGDSDGSAQAERRFVMAVPDPDEPNPDLDTMLLAELLEAEHRFIAFAHTRKATELLMAELNERHPELAQGVLPYRAGYEAKDRQAIEQALNDGSLQGVISTSALELGVDIANMDTCVMFGLPPSTMAFWQRAGRVGREAGRTGHVLVIPGSTSIDYYYQAHPVELLDRPLERLVVQLDNRQVVIGHFACARAERPKGSKFSADILDEDIFGEGFIEFARIIEDVDLDDPVLLSLEPHFDVGIRGIADPSYNILNLPPGMPYDIAIQAARDHRLGTISFSQILREAYPNAVYWHMGRPYRVKRVKIHDQEVVVEKMKETNRRTNPVGEVRVTARQSPAVNIFRRAVFGGDLECWHTMMSVRMAVRGYREREGDRWVDNQMYPQPLTRRMLTEGVWLQLGDGFGPRTPEGLNGAANAIANAYTVMKPCEPTDISASAVMKSTDGTSRIYVYDAVAGGLAITQDLYDRLGQVLDEAIGLVEGCPVCVAEHSDDGCPACVQSTGSYGSDNVSRSAALDVLQRLRAAVSQPPAHDTVTETYKRRAAGMLSSVSAEALQEEVVSAQGSMARRFFPVGSVLRTTTGLEGAVEETFLQGRDRAYWLKSENGKEIQFLDTGVNLTLVEGDIQKECLSCGQSGLDWDEDPCPNCGANVRMAANR